MAIKDNTFSRTRFKQVIKILKTLDRNFKHAPFTYFDMILWLFMCV